MREFVIGVGWATFTSLLTVLMVQYAPFYKRLRASIAAKESAI